jgi:16S rRNA processing protein RimM
VTNKNSNVNDKDWVCVGSLAGAYGVKGETRIKPFTDDPKTIKIYKTLYMEPDMTLVNINITKTIKGGFVGFIKGFNTRENIMPLNGRKLYIKRGKLPKLEKEEYYTRDLVGLIVREADGSEIGNVKGVTNYGAGDLLELHLLHPKKLIGINPIVPFKKEVVTEVNLDAGYVTVLLKTWLESQEVVGEEKNQEER